MARWKVAVLSWIVVAVSGACSTTPQKLSVESAPPPSSTSSATVTVPPAGPPRTNGSLIDSTPDLSDPRRVLYSTARSIGDINVTVDVEADSPMLRNVHAGYKAAPKPIHTPNVSWPIPTDCYPDQSYTVTIETPSSGSPAVARNYDYRFNAPFSVRVASNYGIPPSHESGLWYAIVRVHTPNIVALELVVDERIIDEIKVRNPTELLVGLVAKPALITSNVRVRSFDASGTQIGDLTPFAADGVGTDPPANVAGCTYA